MDLETLFWKRYVGSNEHDIFGLIETAIKVAALGRPDEFLNRRARIAEILAKNPRNEGIGCYSGFGIVESDEDSNIMEGGNTHDALHGDKQRMSVAQPSRMAARTVPKTHPRGDKVGVNGRCLMKPIHNEGNGPKTAEKKENHATKVYGRTNSTQLDEQSLQLKFEASKRKFEEDHRKIEQARKRIQIIDFRKHPCRESGSTKKRRLPQPRIQIW